MKKEKLEIIKALKTILGDCEQFYITGSTVVELQGLTSLSEDIDIVIVNPSPSCVDLLSRFVADSPAILNDSYNGKANRYSFKFQGVKIDVFTDSLKVDSELTYAGIILSSVMQLVHAKKSYHRLKDLKQLKAWSEKLYKHSDLETELEKIIH